MRSCLPTTMTAAHAVTPEEHFFLLGCAGSDHIMEWRSRPLRGAQGISWSWSCAVPPFTYQCTVHDSHACGVMQTWS